MNAADHRFSAALALAAAGATLAPTDEDRLPHATAGCIGGYCLGTLPDLVEPATSPHHRQFFHRCAGGAYLVHLALDATTKRSLPAVGRL